MTKYWLNITKTIKYMSKISRNAIFSELKKQRKTTGGAGHWEDIGGMMGHRGGGKYNFSPNF